MNIIVFGANGRSGREIVMQALHKGYFVTAFVRDSSKLHIKHERLTIETGAVTSYSDVEHTLKKQKFDAVFTALGAKSMFRKDLNVIAAMNNIVAAMQATGQSKIIHISFVGTRKDSSYLNAQYRIFIPLVMRSLLSDHREKEQLIKSSSLQWIIVQPPVLTNGERNGNYIYETAIPQDRNQKLKLKLSRANLAEFMLSLLKSDNYMNQEVFVTE